MNQDLFNVKVRQVLVEAVAHLDPDDREWRIAYCQATGAHGVSVYVEGESLRFVWGGLDLCVVERALLADDTIEEVPPGEWIPAPPDFVPDDWTEA